MAELYREAARRYASLPAFATRQTAMEWQPVSFEALYGRGLDLATALIELGVKARDHVGIFSDNRLEWIVADYGVQLCGAADVPRGRDVSDDELLYIIEHAGIELVFVETSSLQDRLLKLRNRLPAVREIILMDAAATAREGVRTLGDLLARGKQLRDGGDRRAEERIAGIRSGDLFTLIYTSGTTGKPKGVMLTHANMVSQIANLPGRHNSNDRNLSVLPIWHVFERVIEMYAISFGACTYYSGVLTLAEDMQNVEPTIMASAPRLWEKVHERILKGVKASHPVRQVLFHMAYFLARQYKDSIYFLTDTKIKLRPLPWWQRAILTPFHVLRWLLVLPWYGFFNAAVLERIRLTAGGSLVATISGGGALPQHIDRFFNYVGIPVLEGYGMTETSPVISVRPKTQLVVGTVGPPIAQTELRIVALDSGELLYPNDALPYGGRSLRGEVHVRGPQVMKGYYKDEGQTRASMQDGWLRTGDLGMVTHNDCLKILGRSKATIVLSSGENVEPEPIEMRLQQSRFIDQCMVVGQDRRQLGLLVVPVLAEFRQEGHAAGNLQELAADPSAVARIGREVRRLISPQEGFKSYELIRHIRLLPEAFTVGNQLTRLFKIKRHVVYEQYSRELEELFTTETRK